MSEVGAASRKKQLQEITLPNFFPESEVSWKTGQDIVGVGLGKGNYVMKEGKEGLSWDSKFNNNFNLIKGTRKIFVFVLFFFTVTKDLSKMTQSKKVGFILAQHLRVQSSWQDAHGIWSTSWLLWHPQPGNQEVCVLVFTWLFSSTQSRTSSHGSMVSIMIAYHVDNHYSTSYFPPGLVPSEIMS